MKKRIVSLALALLLLVCLLAGCGGGAAEQSAEPSEPAQAAPSEAAPSAPSEAAPEGSAPAEAPPPAEAPVEDALPEGSVRSPGGIVYPLTEEPVTLTYFEKFGFFDQGIDTYNDLPRIADIEAATGIHFEFFEVGFAIAQEQFNLLCASGDLPDLCQVGNYVTGGIGSAYEDEYILDLTDMVEEYCPDWWAALQNTNQVTIDNAYNDGRILQITTITNEYINDMGCLTRGDYLEQLGMEAPTDLAGFEQMLYGYKNELNLEYPIFVKPNAAIQYLEDCFESAIFEVSGASIATYRDGDTVCSGMVSDGYREYLEWFIRLYNDGIFTRDFYTYEYSEAEQFAEVGTGHAGVWFNTSGSLDAAAPYVDEANADMTIVGVPKLVGSDGVYSFGSETMLSDEGYSITTNCKDVELALMFYNWFFTDEGATIANWGKLGESYELDENGDPYWSDAIVGESAGTWAMWLACWKVCPYAEDVWVQFATNSAAENATLEVWNAENVSSDHTIPNGAALTSTETNEISGTVNDVVTYASERILRFITGEEELTDATWADYKAGCDSVGLPGCVAVYQNAYDEYLSGERTAGAAAAAGPGGPPPDGAGGPPPDGAAPPDGAPPPA